MSRKNKKHIIILNNNGVITATSPKNWARGHQSLFEKYDFSNSDNTPTINEIENFLVNNRNFSRIENQEIVILYPFNKL